VIIYLLFGFGFLFLSFSSVGTDDKSAASSTPFFASARVAEERNKKDMSIVIHDSHKRGSFPTKTRLSSYRKI